jgi:lipopolysaccharide heptosyltransferase II
MRQRFAASRLQYLDPRRICIIKPSALGDVVQTLPLLSAFRERFPQATLSWVINSSLADLLDGHPHLDQIIRFDRRGSSAAWMRLLGDLRLQEFDLVFDLQGLLRTAVMSLATRARVRVGLETAREGSQWACHTLIPDTGKHVPAHLRYWRVAETLGMGHLSRETIIPLRDADHAWGQQRLQELGSGILAVHPGAGWGTKRWPVEKFAVLAAKAARHFGSSTVVLGSPDERPLALQLENLVRRFVPPARVLNLAGQTSLKQLASVLSRADVLLTNDSGPMHLAAALGKPVVGVFTSTNPTRSGPPGNGHELIATQLPCGGCYKKRCRYSGKKHLACLDELSTDRVWNALAQTMQQRPPFRRAA